MEKFPKEWITAIFVHGEVLESYKASGINWTYFSPVSQIYAGEHTGKYKLGTMNMIFDDKGESNIS